MTLQARSQITIAIKGAGEMASAVAWRLFQARLGRIFMLEVPRPLAVRRKVSFCEAVYQSRQTVEGLTAVLANEVSQFQTIWSDNQIALLVDPKWDSISQLNPDVVIDAMLAKKNIGTHLNEAPLVIALGPGFTAAVDVHMLIETNRGHHLGRILLKGGAAPNTGIPGSIGGHTRKRVLRAPNKGTFSSRKSICDQVKKGDLIGEVENMAVQAQIDGVIRGLIRNGTPVAKGLKLGDIDPRNDIGYCDTISDKARAISGSVLEAIMRRYG